MCILITFSTTAEAELWSLSEGKAISWTTEAGTSHENAEEI